MLHLDPKELTVQKVQSLMLGGVSPRPIALVSTISAEGIPNLSPFSWFNCFGSNPPTVAFSPSRRIRDGSLKHTYHNIMATKECVIQCVTYPMVQQVSLASTEYPEGVDEFIKSGLTKIPSDIVKPFRVAESPFQMECVLKQMIHLGDGPGSGNMAICEVIRYHIAEDIFENNVIVPDRIDNVARNSADYYTRASGSAIFAVEKPITKTGIGFDQLPKFIFTSQILTANNLAQLANSEQIPTNDDVRSFINAIEPVEYNAQAFTRHERRGEYQQMIAVALGAVKANHDDALYCLERTAKLALDTYDPLFAFKTLLFAESIAQ
jgi:flavin reductase (DIM6/NTAB) family NADH-FMN oxidoreductase RutF